MRNQTLQKQSFLRENSIAAGLLEGARRQKSNFGTGFAAGAPRTDQFFSGDCRKGADL